MDLNFYRFRSLWRIDAPLDEVYAALVDLGDYPSWWPEVRRAVRLSDDAYDLTVRSLLPYDLVITTRQVRRDRAAGVLEAALSGDLDGFTRWTLRGSGTGTLALFEEEVEALKPLLRRFAAVARPAFTANHTLMMRHGQRGLRTYLAGVRAGRRRPADEAATEAADEAQ